MLTVIISAIVGAGSFYGGMKYAQNKQNSNRQARFMMQTGGQQGAAFAGGQVGRMQRNGGGFIMGEIISKDDKSVTVKLQDGGSKIIFVSSDTKISKNAEGSINDIQVGTSISANGTINQDGSVSANSIQVRPAIELPNEQPTKPSETTLPN